MDTAVLYQVMAHHDPTTAFARDSIITTKVSGHPFEQPSGVREPRAIPEPAAPHRERLVAGVA